MFTIQNANNQPATYQVTITNAGYGSTTPSGTDYRSGIIQISATPDSGYSFDHWGSNTELITFVNAYSASTIAVLNDQGTITAHFSSTPPSISVTVKSNYDERGYVSPSGTGGHTYGSSFSVSATPYPGFGFVYWFASGNVVLDDMYSESTNATVYGPATVTAVFVPETYVITLLAYDESGSGYVDNVPIQINGDWYASGSNVSVQGGYNTFQAPDPPFGTPI